GIHLLQCFKQAPMITKLLLGGPEKGERTPRTGKTTALLLSITPFLEVIINFMASSQMKLRVLLLVISDRASILEQSFCCSGLSIFLCGL
ncbi:hypothetical protein MTR67_031816, partial [Solanum verrucosum]